MLYPDATLWLMMVSVSVSDEKWTPLVNVTGMVVVGGID